MVDTDVLVFMGVLEVAESVNDAGVLETAKIDGAIKNFKTHYALMVATGIGAIIVFNKCMHCRSCISCRYTHVA